MTDKFFPAIFGISTFINTKRIGGRGVGGVNHPKNKNHVKKWVDALDYHFSSGLGVVCVLISPKQNAPKMG
jgi:hypothetical protein